MSWHFVPVDSYLLLLIGKFVYGEYIQVIQTSKLLCNGVTQPFGITGMVLWDPHIKRSVKLIRVSLYPIRYVVIPYPIDYDLMVSIVIGSSMDGIVLLWLQ